jgi:hypothetical protein
MSKQVQQSGPKMGSSILRTDTCVSPFQDAMYGRGVRVHNVGKGKARCTVCSREVIS